jgi:outer membrane protein OmpA-like peptidoglycan-associated protein
MPRRLILAAAALAASLWSGHALADATIPTRDIANARDNPLLPRYDGSFIVDYAQRAFDELELPIGVLKEVPNKKDGKNNAFHAPEHAKALEGRLTRIVYVAPAGRSPLEVIGNYVDEVAGKGGQALYRCREQDCGGENRYGIDSGGGRQSLLMKIYPVDDLRQPYKSNGYCAVTSKMGGFRYAALQVPVAGGEAHVAVATYQLNDDLYCKALNGRTVVVVTIMEPRQREQRMVTVAAADMNAALGREGRIVLYNILFDFDKADLKPESRPQLAEIAKLLQANPALRLHVVGHTDNQGQLAYNMDLSRRRAQAVVQALAQSHGIAAARLLGHGVGPIAPVAPNTDEAGRARNRRTELVPQ